MDEYRRRRPAWRFFGLFGLAGLAFFAAGQADAVTIKALKGMRLETLYGRYAPGGDCTRKPVISVDDAGFGFDVGGRVLRPVPFEYAASYGGRDYAGISSWFFPFIVNDDDMGPLLLTMNADEKRGRLIIESNLAPGQRLAPDMAVVLRGSPYAKCAR